MTRTRKRELNGPFKEARAWLARYADNNGIKLPTVVDPLEDDWSGYSKAHCAYVLGVVWGRLRQIDNDLENATHYANLVKAELQDAE